MLKPALEFYRQEGLQKSEDLELRVWKCDALLAAALAELGDEHQVLVVTHLPQVAAFADAQVMIEKQVAGESTATTARPVAGDERVVELSRMLSGQPDSATARQHAREVRDVG